MRRCNASLWSCSQWSAQTPSATYWDSLLPPRGQHKHTEKIMKNITFKADSGIRRAVSYLPSGAVSKPPQLIQPAVRPLDGQHGHCHANERRTLELRLYCVITHPHPLLFHSTPVWLIFVPLLTLMRRGGPTPGWQHIPPGPGRRWWTTGGCERRYLRPPDSPSLCWPFHLYR